MLYFIEYLNQKEKFYKIYNGNRCNIILAIRQLCNIIVYNSYFKGIQRLQEVTDY